MFTSSHANTTTRGAFKCLMPTMRNCFSIIIHELQQQQINNQKSHRTCCETHLTMKRKDEYITEKNVILAYLWKVQFGYSWKVFHTLQLLLCYFAFPAKIHPKDFVMWIYSVPSVRSSILISTPSTYSLPFKLVLLRNH